MRAKCPVFASQGLLLGFLLLQSFLRAQTCNPLLCVSSTGDSAANPAAGTLRYAIRNSSAGDVITFSPSLSGKAIVLDASSPNNHLLIAHDLTLQGPGASSLTISGGNGTRIFLITGGNVVISDLTLSNGHAKGGDSGSGLGGGGGSAGMGGGIFINTGNVTIRNVTMLQNTAEGGAGGAGAPLVVAAQGGGGGGGFGGDGGASVNTSGGAAGSGGDLGASGAGGMGTIGGSFGNPVTGGGYYAPFGGGGGGGPVQLFCVTGSPIRPGAEIGDCYPSSSSGGRSYLGGGGGGGISGGSPGVSQFGGSGGASASGGGGGGGAGAGGAVFAAAGSVLIVNSTFLGNRSIGGAPGASGGSSGHAKGGAVFVCAASWIPCGANVIVANSAFQSSTAADAGAVATCAGRDDADICGPLVGSTPTHFSITGNATYYTGVPFAFAVTALDANNQTVFAYTGKLHFTSSDPSAILPPDSTLVQGTGSFSGTFESPAQTITATDAANSALAATLGPFTETYFSTTALEVTPASGSGNTHLFSFTFSDPAGYQDLNVVNVLINHAIDSRNACYLAYSRPLDVLYLVNDAGTALSAGLTLNSSGGIGNSQCSVSSAGSSAVGVGDTLTLTLSVTLSSAFAGNQIVYLAAGTNSGSNSGWQAGGAWTVPGASTTSPAVISVQPAHSQLVGAGYTREPVTATFTFTDSKGWQDIGVVDILINSALDGRQACYIAYAGGAVNHFYLVNDAGTALLPDVSIAGAPLSNSQCTFTSGTVTTLGNTLTLTLPIAFTSQFQGNRVVYAAARSVGDVSNSGWQPVGVWSVFP